MALTRAATLFAYLKPHVLHRACGNNGGHLADAGLHDDLTEHLVRDNLLHGAGHFVANRLFHKGEIVLFRHRLLAIIAIISIKFAGSSIQDGSAHIAFKVRNKKAKSFMDGAPGAQEERLGATSLGNEKSR